MLSSFYREIAGVSGLKPDSGPSIGRRLRSRTVGSHRAPRSRRAAGEGAVAAAPPHVQQPSPAIGSLQTPAARPWQR